MDDGLHRRHHVSFNETTDGLGVENKPKYASSTNKPNVKPAIKQQVSLLPPAERYQHPDPLLRRLRLRDGHGEPVNLRQMFRDTKKIADVIVYVCSASHLTQIIANLCRRYPREIKVIYVSVDTDERHYVLGTRNQPWLSMEWNDGSSVDPNDKEHQFSPESFLLAEDDDLDEGVVQTDSAGTSYVRPFSRVYLTFKLNVLLTPTLAVYHLPSRKFLDQSVRQSRLRPSRAEETIATWLRGEVSPGFNVMDMVYQAPWITALLFASLLYLLATIFWGSTFSMSRLESWIKTF